MLLFKRYEYNPQADLLGKGGFSRVYKALDKKLNRWVALKIYKSADISERYSLGSEIQRVINLDHPNISRYLDIDEIENENAFGEIEKIQVCVMELLDGGNILKYYNEHKTPEILIGLLVDVLNGLSYLHQNDIIHRDIKPGNILIKNTLKGPVAKITDFGISKISGAVSENDSSSALIVSIPYMAPEQLNTKKFGIAEKVSFNIDLWSLGVAVYEIVSGDVLFKNSVEDSPEQIMANIMAPGIPDKIVNLPEPFYSFVSNCIIKDAKVRTRNADDLIPILKNKTTVPATPEVEPAKEEPVTPLPISSNEEKMEDQVNENQPAIETVLDTPDNEETVIINKKMSRTFIEETEDVSVPAAPAAELIAEEDASGTALPLQPIAVPAEEDPDHTVLPEQEVIKNPETTSASIDDTQILFHRTHQDPVAEPGATDDTQILYHQTQAASSSPDDTQLLAGTGALAAASSSPDDTQLLARESDLADKNAPGTGEIKLPAGSPVKEKEAEETHSDSRILLFNRYEYYPSKNLIGKGGFSRVYKAFDKKLSRWVALKIYKTGEFSDRYSPIAEIQRVVNLDHSNICRYLDIEEIEKVNPFGERENIQVCVMELLDSGNLAEYYSKNPDINTFKKLLTDVFKGLSYLHKNGIIHRDIKPANILIKESMDGPIAKITDFGISKKSDAVNNNSSSALVVSIPYMAPEQLNVKKYGVDEKISFNLDLWSLGVTIYEVLTGKVLFKNSDADNSEQIMTNIMAPELPEKIKELDSPFREIVSRCIVKKATDRAQRVEELIAILDKSLVQQNERDAIEEKRRSPVLTVDSAKNPQGSFQEEEESPEPVPGINAGAAGKAKFYVLEEGPHKANKKFSVKTSHLVLALAAALVIAAGIYFLSQKQKPETTNELTNAKPATDTVKTTGTTKLNEAAATARKTDSLINAPADTGSIISPVQKPAHSKDDSNKPIQPGKQDAVHIPTQKKPKEAPTAPKSATADKYVLEFTTSGDCTVKINSIDYGELRVGGILKARLSPGRYQIKATSSSSNTEIYSNTFEVTNENLGMVGHIRISSKN